MIQYRDPKAADSDEELQQWTRFLHAYSTGDLSRPTPPPLSPNSAEVCDPLNIDKISGSFVTDGAQGKDVVEEAVGDDFSRPVYTSVEITSEVSRRVRDFYTKNGFLPPPRAPLEDLREECILEYDLYSRKQVEKIQRAIDLVQAVFGGICTFTLFKNSVQELIALSGPPEVIDAVGLYPGKRLLPETSLCGHSVLCPGTNLYVENLVQDWRYTGNPYADELKGVKSYLGSAVSLSIDPSSNSKNVPVVGIGVINSMHLAEVLPPPTERQNKVMRDITTMLQDQLRATWEGQGRTREARSRRAVADLLEDTLVSEESFLPPQSPFHMDGSDLPDELDQDERRTSTSHREPGTSSRRQSTSAMSRLESCARAAVKQIALVVEEVTSVVIVDLRSFHPVTDAAGQIQYTPDPDSGPTLPTLAAKGHNGNGNAMWSDKTIVGHFLDRYREDRKFLFDSTNLPFTPNRGPSTGAPGTGTETSLPRTMLHHISMPFFVAEQPLFLILASSPWPFARSRYSDINFIRSVGVILRANIVQSRVNEADLAKTAFLSSISHELRTPMHGILSGLHLIREAVDSSDLVSAENTLAVMEASGYALQQILNDVLDFGSLAQGRAEGSRKTRSDLERAVMAVATTCAPLRDRGGGLGEKEGDVQVVIELEERDWTAEFDEAGFQRVLFNGLTNALKITRQGEIRITLTSSPDNQSVKCVVTDTGPGIDPVFATKQFEAFTKADEFAPGAGLGLYIVRKLVHRMGGQVSLASRTDGRRGAMFTVALPIDLLGSRPANVVLRQRTTRSLGQKQVQGQGRTEAKMQGTMGAVVRPPLKNLYSAIPADFVLVGSTKSHNAKGSQGDSDGTNDDTGKSQNQSLNPGQTLDDQPAQTLLSKTASGNSSSPLTQRTSSNSRNNSTGHTTPLRVLVVDDNDIGSRILLTLLKQMGKKNAIVTASAKDGVEALEVFEVFRPHLVLTDVSMPRMDGITAASRMRALELQHARVDARREAEVVAGVGDNKGVVVGHVKVKEQGEHEGESEQGQAAGLGLELDKDDMDIDSVREGLKGFSIGAVANAEASSSRGRATSGRNPTNLEQRPRLSELSTVSQPNHPGMASSSASASPKMTKSVSFDNTPPPSRMSGRTRDGSADHDHNHDHDQTPLHRRCKIYAITGLGSSDPRLKVHALMGTAALDGWLIKGRDTSLKVREVVLGVIKEREGRASGPGRVEA